MIQTEVLEISISGEAAARVREALKSGEYGSANEVVADALRHWHPGHDGADIELLRTAWEQAVQDSKPAVEPESVFKAVRARLASRLKEDAEACG